MPGFPHGPGGSKPVGEPGPGETQELPVVDFNPDPIHAHRVQRFLDLGFTQVDAIQLAAAKGDDGFSLYWGRVKIALAAGCTHVQAVAIYA